MPISQQGIATAVLLASTTSSWGQEAPNLGLLYSTSESNSLVYRCSSRQGGQLFCEFTQTSVRLKATYADLAPAIQKARNAFPSEKPWSAEDCNTARQTLEVLEGKRPAPKPEAVAAMSDVAKRDAAAIVRATLGYCNNPTEESFVNLVRAGAERDRRTCKVSSNTFSQSFTRAEGVQKPPTWVAQSKPEGQCGVVQLSRFEPEVVQFGKSSITNWKYVARKAITNPSGELFPGAKCSDLDERPYTYDWRSKDQQLSCDYIEFTPL